MQNNLLRWQLCLGLLCLSLMATAQPGGKKNPQTPPRAPISIPLERGVSEADQAEWMRASRKVEQAMQMINGTYMEDVEADKVAEDAIKGLLEELDPHSTYFSAEEYRKANEPIVGNFEGIGVQFNLVKDTITIVGVIVGGPSEKVGIQLGDQIIKVGEETVAGIEIKTDEVTKRLRGPKNTEVQVGIRRKGEPKLLDFVIVRDKIPLYSLDANYMVDPTTGYIKVSRFASTTTEEMMTALKTLKGQGMKDLILDLRGNGGGLLNAAYDMAGMFLPRNRLVVYTEGRKSPRYDYTTRADGIFTDGRLVVLIDEGSASASEIVSGAVQDWDRGLVIGRRSFGKGLVQKPFMLYDSSFLRLTVAHYYTPSGRSIQKPYDEGRETYYEDVKGRLERGELTDKEKISMPDSLKFKTLVQKRTVYGGGGIMPDVFVPLDTSLNFSYYNELNRKNILNQYIIKYVNDNRTALSKQYPDINTFAKQYTVSDAQMEQLIAYAAAEGVQLEDRTQFNQVLPQIRVLLKASMARYLWNLNAFVQIHNEINPAYKKALEVLHDNTFNQLLMSEVK